MSRFRFVILEHDWPELHWDLLLEWKDVLRAWRLLAHPETRQAFAATAIADHRRFYLDYEGPVSGNRGTVVRWDAGEFEWQVDLPRRVSVMLDGKKCAGCLQLVWREGNDWQAEWIVEQQKTDSAHPR